MPRWAGAGVALVIGTIVFPPFAARAQDSSTVEIRDNYFTPAEIHVLEGGTVTWTDMGGAHTVTSDDGVSFDSSPACIAQLNCMATGDTFSHTFRAAETITYHCRVHGSAMVGKVVVESASTTTTSTSTSTTTTIDTTTTSSDASAAPGGDQRSQLSQFPLPSLPSSSRSAALPRPIARDRDLDDLRPWALVAVAIAALTTIAGVVLVRRGRVPFG